MNACMHACIRTFIHTHTHKQQRRFLTQLSAAAAFTRHIPAGDDASQARQLELIFVSMGPTVLQDGLGEIGVARAGTNGSSHSEHDRRDASLPSVFGSTSSAIGYADGNSYSQGEGTDGGTGLERLAVFGGYGVANISMVSNNAGRVDASLPSVLGSTPRAMASACGDCDSDGYADGKSAGFDGQHGLATNGCDVSKNNMGDALLPSVLGSTSTAIGCGDGDDSAASAAGQLPLQYTMCDSINVEVQTEFTIMPEVEGEEGRVSGEAEAGDVETGPTEGPSASLGTSFGCVLFGDAFTTTTTTAAPPWGAPHQRDGPPQFRPRRPSAPMQTPAMRWRRGGRRSSWQT